MYIIGMFLADKRKRVPSMEQCGLAWQVWQHMTIGVVHLALYYWAGHWQNRFCRKTYRINLLTIVFEQSFLVQVLLRNPQADDIKTEADISYANIDMAVCSYVHFCQTVKACAHILEYYYCNTHLVCHIYEYYNAVSDRYECYHSHFILISTCLSRHVWIELKRQWLQWSNRVHFRTVKMTKLRAELRRRPLKHAKCRWTNTLIFWAELSQATHTLNCTA